MLLSRTIASKNQNMCGGFVGESKVLKEFKLLKEPTFMGNFTDKNQVSDAVMEELACVRLGLNYMPAEPHRVLPKIKDVVPRDTIKSFVKRVGTSALRRFSELNSQ